MRQELKCLNGADLVVAHAKWRKSRGKQPSMPYHGIGDPRKALALAKIFQGIEAYLTEIHQWQITASGKVVARIYTDYKNQVEKIVMYDSDPLIRRRVKELALSHAIQFVMERPIISREILALAPKRELWQYNFVQMMGADMIPEGVERLSDELLDKYLAVFAVVAEGGFGNLAEMLKSLQAEIKDAFGISITVRSITSNLIGDKVGITITSDQPFKFWKSVDSYSRDDESRLYITPPYHPTVNGKKHFCLINGSTDYYIGGQESGITTVHAPFESRRETARSAFGSTWGAVKHPFYAEGETFSMEICPVLCLTQKGYRTLFNFLAAALNQGDGYIEISGGFDPPFDYPSNILARKKIKSPAERFGPHNCRGSEHHCVWEYRTLEAEGQLAGAKIPSWLAREGWLNIYAGETGKTNKNFEEELEEEEAVL